MNPVPTLRIARPTRQLETLRDLYSNGLGLKILGEFRDHDGFDGVMLGHPDHSWHLEFTSSRHPAGKAPSEENLLVFYYPDTKEWEKRCDNMEAAGFKRVPSLNPYWDNSGRTYEDPDGYRVVIQNAEWNY